MELTQIRDMLEAEMDASKKFTAENFGLKVGDGFPEMVREIVKSEKLAGTLMCSMLMMALSGKEVAESMRPVSPADKVKMGAAILNNIATFEVPLSLFYWGVQVGRRLEREQRNFFSNVEL